MSKRYPGLVPLCAALGLMTAGPAAAADPIKLRVADSFPSGHYLTKLIIQPWMAEVTKRTNGAVTFEYFPSQQLGKAADMLTLTQTGVTNIGYVAPAYVSEKMPHSEAAMLPGSFETSCQGTMAYWKVAREGTIAAQDYAPNKIRLLVAVALPPYQILTVKNPVKTEQDIRGLKLRTTGGAQDLTVRTIGAVPVRMAAPDTYESLSRGTLDGVVFPLDSVVSYNVEKIVRYSTEGANFSSFIVAYSISDASWNALPADVRKVIQDVSQEIVPVACAAVDRQEAETKQKLVEAGVQFTPVSPEFRSKLDEMLKDVASKWAQGLDGRGRKGSAVLAEFRKAVAEQPAK
ncbi:TRAP transporter substrate-binding protein DctP [Enterovirga aerilata]|nr:TRAP transporter substrate-binding protein DctP [Enterovirga sp. DB1703]